MKTFSYQSIIVLLTGLISIRCTNVTNDDHTSPVRDTAIIVQTVLADKLLESEIIKDFGKQTFKLVEGPASKTKQQFMFAGNPVKVVPSTGDFYQIHQQHPKELYVSVPEIKIFSKDSATALLIFHAGNATALFQLKNKKEKWTITGRQYGKF